METSITNLNDSTNITSKADTSTTEKITPEEEEAIVTLVVIVIGVIIVIAILFTLAIFIDCKHQKKNSMQRKRLRIRLPPHVRRGQKDDVKALASNMCPNGTSDTGFQDNGAGV